MTQRQREAMEWLESVGKSTAKLARRHGFQQRTLDALADAGLIQRDYMPRTIGGPFPVYRPKEEAHGSAAMNTEVNRPHEWENDGWCKDGVLEHFKCVNCGESYREDEPEPAGPCPGEVNDE